MLTEAEVLLYPAGPAMISYSSTRLELIRKHVFEENKRNYNKLHIKPVYILIFDAVG